MVKYDDSLSSFRLWDPKLASMSVKYYTCISFGNRSFIFRALCIGLISVRFNLAVSKHYNTFPFSFGKNTHLFHHSDVVSTSKGIMIVVFVGILVPL